MSNAFKKLIKTWDNCTECKIGCGATKKVFGVGAIPARYLFVGEAPGVGEDRSGEPFVGRSGVLLRNTLENCQFDSSQFFITNIVACRPSDEDGRNRAPTVDEINNCLERLHRTILAINPKVIIAIGKVAYNTFCKYSNALSLLGKYVTDIQHPAYILRNGGEKGDKYHAWFKTIQSLQKL